MKPSGSGPLYSPPGSWIDQFGVTRQNESHRRDRQVSALRPASRHNVIDAGLLEEPADAEARLPGPDDRYLRALAHSRRRRMSGSLRAGLRPPNVVA